MQKERKCRRIQKILKTWTKKGQAKEVNVYDFLHLDWKGDTIWYLWSKEKWRNGNVGMSYDTPNLPLKASGNGGLCLEKIIIQMQKAWWSVLMVVGVTEVAIKAGNSFTGTGEPNQYFAKKILPNSHLKHSKQFSFLIF